MMSVEINAKERELLQDWTTARQYREALGLIVGVAHARLETLAMAGVTERLDHAGKPIRYRVRPDGGTE